MGFYRSFCCCLFFYVYFFSAYIIHIFAGFHRENFLNGTISHILENQLGLGRVEKRNDVNTLIPVRRVVVVMVAADVD